MPTATNTPTPLPTPTLERCCRGLCVGDEDCPHRADCPPGECDCCEWPAGCVGCRRGGPAHYNPDCYQLEPLEADVSQTGFQAYTARADPGAGAGADPAGEAGLRYDWYAYFKGGSALASSPKHDQRINIEAFCWKGALDCDYAYMDKNSWSTYTEFTPSESGRLDWVEIGHTNPKYYASDYLGLMVTDATGNTVLTDNTGFYGGLDCWVPSGTTESCYSYVGPEGGSTNWLRFTFKLKPWLEAGQTYRIYAKPRTDSRWGWYKNTCVPPSPNCGYKKGGYLFRTNLLDYSPYEGSYQNQSGNGTTEGTADWYPPSEAVLDEDYAIVVQVSDGTSYPRGPYGAGICPLGTAHIIEAEPTPTPSPTPTPNAWFQAQGGDIHGNNDVTSLIPSTCIEPTCLPYLSLTLDGFNGFVSTGGEIDWGEGNLGEDEDWYLEGENISFAGDYTYDYFVNQWKGETFESEESDINAISDPGAGKVRLYRFRGSPSYTFNSNKFNANPIDGALLVLVAGNLKIEKNIKLGETGFIAFIIQGNLNLDEAVNELHGFYLADGSLNTGSGDEPFLGKGIFVSWSGINLERDLGDGNQDTPAELFEYLPALLMNAPEQMRKPRINWKEVAG